MYYITPEHYKIAKENGISETRVYQRVNSSGWIVERAITEPVKKAEGLWKKWKDVAKEHGVQQSTFYYRIKHKGMTPEQAATTLKHTGRIKESDYARAKEIGLSRHTVRRRMYIYDWVLEEAVTTPPFKPGQSRKGETK